MKSKDIEILIEKYLDGETTPEEEKALAAEVSRDDAPQEWKIIAEMLGELTVDEALYDKMMAERNKKPRIIKLWPWVAAACVAAILLMIPTPPKEEGQKVAKVEEVKPEQPEPIKSEETKLVEEVTIIDKMTDTEPVTRQKAEKGNTIAIHNPLKDGSEGLARRREAESQILALQVAKVETVENEPQQAEVTTEPTTATSSSEPSQATEDIFDATLANVRRAALQKMMSCDMQCMNEDINLRATHLSTLIQEQNQ